MPSISQIGTYKQSSYSKTATMLLGEKRKKPKISFGYEHYLAPELLNSIVRHSSYISKIRSMEQQFDSQVPNLRNSWVYQRVVSWLYVVCESYVTTTLFHVKPLWKDINFNEFFLLEDILSGSGKLLKEDEDGLNDDDGPGLFHDVKTRLLKQLPHGRHAVNLEDSNNSNSNETVSIDAVINEYLKGINELHLVYDHTKETFDSIPLSTQFEIIYHVIKYIESKSMIFRNYATLRPELFKFIHLGTPQREPDQRVSVVTLALQNPFSVVKRVQSHKNSQFHVPVKLKHCTVRYEEENQLVYLDYTKEIETYLGSIKLDYEVLSYNFDGLLQLYDSCVNKKENTSYLFKNGVDEKILMEKITNGAELMIQTCKVWIQRERDKTLQELLTRRKRSSRLLVREEEVRKRELEEQLSEKFDKRESFLKHRHRNVARLTKKCKDLLWSDLWVRFNQDVKAVAKRNRDLVTTTELPMGSPLSAADHYVLKSGDTFKMPIIDINRPISDKDEPINMEESGENTKNTLEKPSQSTNSPTPQELPEDICITQDDISSCTDLDISLPKDITGPDNCTDWTFQCVCAVGRKPTHFSTTDPEEVNREKYMELKLINGTPIICCDICFRWQHWGCQDTNLIQCVSLSAARSVKDIPKAKIFTQRDFGTVPMNLSDLHPHHLERSTSAASSFVTDSPYESDLSAQGVRRGRRRSTRKTRAQSMNFSPYLEQADEFDTDTASASVTGSTDQSNTKQEKDLKPKRPTDRRTRFGECAVFMCGYCLSKYEQQLRDVFVPELEILRAKQKRQHEDRERRKLAKMQKKKEEEEKARANAEMLSVTRSNTFAVGSHEQQVTTVVKAITTPGVTRVTPAVQAIPNATAAPYPVVNSGGGDPTLTVAVSPPEVTATSGDTETSRNNTKDDLSPSGGAPPTSVVKTTVPVENVNNLGSISTGEDKRKPTDVNKFD